ncbi:MAG TPA: pyridoxamine 5'-phosphate oxidase family protein [Candidatus Bathyarchaeia archaeon]|nr:pyridoxamine 5'-phosphate oxidase family protein [Candidatus Bathyarchaeia archaeon]
MNESVFLKENKLMNLASTAADGGPQVVPVAFMYDDGKLYISAGEWTRKIRNIRKDSRVSFSVEDSTRQKAIVGKGTARILPPGRSHDELLKKLIVHLVGGVDHPYAKIMMAANRVIVEIAPNSIRGWELPPT